MGTMLSKIIGNTGHYLKAYYVELELILVKNQWKNQKKSEVHG